MAGSLADAALAALGQVQFDYTRELKSIWSDRIEDHVAQVNGDIQARLFADFLRRTRETQSQPLGWALVGQAGAGKTHLLGSLRREVWESGGWFVLLDLLDVNDFWGTAALGFVDSLMRPMADGATQGVALFGRLCERLELAPALCSRLIAPASRRRDRSARPQRLPEPVAAEREAPESSTLQRLLAGIAVAFGRGADRDAARPAWDSDAREFVEALHHADPLGADAHRDVVFAFLALLSGSSERRGIGRAWLNGADVDTDGRRALLVQTTSISRRKAVEGLSWLMSLAGPTLCAVDQIDAIISVAHAAAGTGAAKEDPARNRALAVIDELAGGLMDMRDVTTRAVTVVSTLEATWETLCGLAIAPFRDRFDLLRLRSIGSADAARFLVEKRLAKAYREAEFTPPYPSWPFRPEAFAGVLLFTPRQLLQACRAHIDGCLEHGEVRELSAFPGTRPGQDVRDPPPPPPPPPAHPSDLAERYAALCAMPAPAGLLDPGAGEDPAADLLVAALSALVRQTEVPDTHDYLVEHDPPGLHARLRLIDNAAGGQERHHCFRVIPQTNAIAMQGRLQTAITASGIDRELPFRHLIVLRRGDWPTGPKSAALVQQFEQRGGLVMAPDAEDFARFAALRALLAEAPPGLDAWLRARRPLADSPFFRNLGLIDDAPQSGALPLGIRPGAATA